MSKEFCVAIVGCGNIAALHAACLKELEGVRVVATVDTKIERAQAMASEFKAAAYSDLTTMLAEAKPDVIHICTPHYLHARMAMEAAEAGVAVFTEKPPAMNRRQWEVLEDAAKLVPLGICFQNRYNDNVVNALKRMRAGEFGKLKGARAQVYWHRDAAYYADDWHGTWALEGGGVLINQSIHTLDLMNLFVDAEVTDVEAGMSNRSLKTSIEVEDTVDAYIRYGDIPALFYATNAYSTNAPVSIELDCELARVLLDGGDLVIYRNDGEVERVGQEEMSATGFKDYWGLGHASCIADFYQALAKGAKVPIAVGDIRSSMDLVFRIYESCGRPAIAEQL